MIDSSLTEQQKILIFTIEDELYGLDILPIRHVARLKETDKWKIGNPSIPSLKYFSKLQEDIIPLIDLRTKIGYGHKKYGPNTPVIFVNINSFSIALTVDSVLNVSEYPSEKTEQLPEFYYQNNQKYFSKAFIQTNNIVCILNEKELFTESELDYLERVTKEAYSKLG